MKRMISLLMVVLIMMISVCASAISLSDLKMGQDETSSKEQLEALIPPLPYRLLGMPSKCIGIVEEGQYKGVGYLFPFPQTQGKMMELLFQYSDCIGTQGFSRDIVTIAETRGLFFKSDAASILVIPYYIEDNIVVLVNEPTLLSFFVEGTTPEDVFSAMRDDLETCTAEGAQSAAISASLYWPTSNQVEAFNTAIHQNYEITMPFLIRADYYTDWSSNGKVKSSEAIDFILRDVIISAEGINASLSRTVFIGEIILPLLSQKYGIDVLTDLSISLRSDDVSQSLPTFTNELQPGMGLEKYIVLNTTNNLETCQINYTGNLMLPLEKVATSMEDATRYIVCSTEWNELASGSWIGGTPYKPETSISIYDAKTGYLISSLEPVVVNPSGYVGSIHPGPIIMTSIKLYAITSAISEQSNFQRD